MSLQKCFIAAAAVILAGPLGQAQQTFRVVTYNVENFILEPIQNRPLKKPFAQAKIVESILAAKPDVIALQEMGKKTALIKLQAALKAKGLDLPHVEHLSAFDPAIHVAYLSRFPFKKITRHDNESFLLNGRRLHVSRGFAEVEIALGGYSFSLITAHLKSKRKVSVADEAEMRLQEALRLRRIIDARLKANPEMNFAVLGDFNDYYNSKPLKALVGRGKSKLVDARPGEKTATVARTRSTQNGFRAMCRGRIFTVWRMYTAGSITSCSAPAWPGNLIAPTRGFRSWRTGATARITARW